PITKTIQKEMLPVIDRPAIDYVVDDLIKAGITEIIFVISEHNNQVLHYYSENSRLENYLKKIGKDQIYEKIRDLHKKAQFHFVKQADSDPYGTAIPVKLAKEYLLNEEAFVVLMGDDILYNADGSSETARMIKHLSDAGANSLAAFVKQPTERLKMYGVADIVEKNGVQYLKNLVEKPAPGTAPSNLANISKYILTPEVFEIMDQQELDPKSGELYITDTVTILAKTQDVAIYEPQGAYLDCGYPLGWLKANLAIAKNNPEIWPELKAFWEKNNF
ncbi:MAG: sugar phosphate nucleotidyltransferase, partial [Candidatus Paceibacterota bacterium]